MHGIITHAEAEGPAPRSMPCLVVTSHHITSHLGEGGGGSGPVVVVLGHRLRRAGEGAAALLEVLVVLVVAVVLRGVEVDAGAALQGREEGGRHAGGHPHGVALHVPIRQDAAVGVDSVHGCRPLPLAPAEQERIGDEAADVWSVGWFGLPSGFRPCVGCCCSHLF